MGTGPVFRKTYEMHPNPPAAMIWEDYERRVFREWHTLMNSPDGCKERNIHQFLIKHPSLVPMVSRSPFPSALISQPPLVGIGQKIPDFLWIARDSLNLRPVFIEIESPCKRWFTQAGVPHHEFTQALNQLGQWRAWLNQPANQLNFFEQFLIPGGMRRDLHFSPHFILIYGRRREFEQHPELSRLRAQFERGDQQVMTFDRLEPSAQNDIYISATKTQQGYRALSVPAVFKWSPMIVEELMTIQGVPDAIRANDWISPNRRDFLVERYAYWENWNRGDRGRMFSTGDWE
jgi:hypothetical protein